MIIKGDLRATGASFSDDMQYRYELWRTWGKVFKPRICAFVMLNPSTADESVNDPTVERCERRARSWGYDGLFVMNIFALRSTDPKALYKHADPVGPENDSTILTNARLIDINGGVVIAAWGTHGALKNRGQSVADRLWDNQIVMKYLKLSKHGLPMHPLYLNYALTPQAWL